MSEIFVKNLNALTVSNVLEGSPASKIGLKPGDLVRSINGKSVLDILDYRYHSAASRLNIEIERAGETSFIMLRKKLDEDAGLEFESDLGDRVHTCKNKCVFCFIHQQPKKMRKSLYLMDDDFRLSFMHGNYVTLTNLSQEEWDRILEQRLSPLYVSVHATDPELRAVLLGRSAPTPILEQLDTLAQHRISTHAQVVLCPGLNDGDALDRTLEELSTLHPSVTGRRTGVESVAIVPIGLTRFRERLPNMMRVEREFAQKMIQQVEAHARRFKNTLGTRFVWLGDEWYHIAGKSYPGKAHYEEFPQLEDGIGTMRLFMEDLKAVERRLPRSVPVEVRATLVTAELPADIVKQMVELFNKVDGVHLNVCVVKNSFFGGNIHIAGLLTASDILEQLSTFAERADTVYLPSICLRDEILFLDDLTVEDARLQSGIDLRVTGCKPRDLAEKLGLITPNGRHCTNSNLPRQVMEEHPVETPSSLFRE